MELKEKLNRKIKSLCIILDPAHGQDVAGKRSPDGKYQEWKGSRNLIESIKDEIKNIKSPNWTLAFPYKYENNEPGLRARVKEYNDIAKDYDLTIVISLHNDAFKNPPEWWKSKGGFTFFTSRGETEADPICTFIGEKLQLLLKKETFRFDYGLTKLEKNKDLDREANFTVITGFNIGRSNEVKANYAGILIENLFMDIKENYDKLMDPEWNKKLKDAYVITLLLLATELGFDNCIDAVTVKPKK